MRFGALFLPGLIKAKLSRCSDEVTSSNLTNDNHAVQERMGQRLPERLIGLKLIPEVLHDEIRHVV
jgi:hypothetical protein